MSLLRENLGNGRLSVFRWAAVEVVGPPAGWQLDKSIPTNCFNYFSPSSSTPNLFHHPSPSPVFAPGQFTFGGRSHGGPFPPVWEISSSCS